MFILRIKSKGGDYTCRFGTNCQGCYARYKMHCVDELLKSYFRIGFRNEEIISQTLCGDKYKDVEAAPGQKEPLCGTKGVSCITRHSKTF